MYKAILSAGLAMAIYMLPTAAAANPTSTSVEQTQVKKKPAKKKKAVKKKIQDQLYTL